MVVHVAVEEPSKHVRAPEWPLLISLWVCVHPLGVSAEQRPCGTDGILAPAAICDRGHLLRRWVWRRRCMMCGSLRLGCGRRRHGLERDAQCHPFCRAITCTLDRHARGKIAGGRPGDELLEGTVADDPLRIFVPPLLSALGRRLVGRTSSRLDCVVCGSSLFGDGVTSPARRPGRSRGRSWRCRGAAWLVAQYDAQVATDALNGALGRRRLGASPRAVCCRQHKSPRQSRRYVGRSSSWCSCLPLLSPRGALGVHIVQVHTGQAPVDTRAEVRAVVTLHPARCLAQPRRLARRGGTSLGGALAPLRHWRSLCVSSAHGGCVCLIRPHEACLLSTPGLPPWGSSQRSGEGDALVRRNATSPEMRHRAPSDATMAAVNCNAAAACTRAAAPPRQASASSPASFGQPSRQLRAAHSASLSGQAVGAHRVGCYRCVAGLPLHVGGALRPHLLVVAALSSQLPPPACCAGAPCHGPVRDGAHVRHDQA